MVDKLIEHGNPVIQLRLANGGRMSNHERQWCPSATAPHKVPFTKDKKVKLTLLKNQFKIQLKLLVKDRSNGNDWDEVVKEANMLVLWNKSE